MVADNGLQRQWSRAENPTWENALEKGSVTCKLEEPRVHQSICCSSLHWLLSDRRENNKTGLIGPLLCFFCLLELIA